MIWGCNIKRIILPGRIYIFSEKLNNLMVRVDKRILENVKKSEVKPNKEESCRR